MLLTTPAVEELQALELPQLLDLLSIQTSDYFKHLKTEGISSQTNVLKECIKNIQTVIEMKRELEKNTTDTGSSVSFTQDTTSFDTVN